MQTRLRYVGIPALFAAAALAGCGNTTGGPPEAATRTASAEAPQPTSTVTPAQVDTASSAAPSDSTSTDAAASTAPSAAASVAPAGSSALPGVPAVANATDLTKQPIAAAGTGAAKGGLITRDLVVGKGTAAVATDTVRVKYAGTIYSNGKSFDASWTDGAQDQTATFPLSGVVPGFAEGIVGMKPGGRREIVIPPALGYGPQGGQPQAGISATDTLVFIVDYVGIGQS